MDWHLNEDEYQNAEFMTENCPRHAVPDSSKVELPVQMYTLNVVFEIKMKHSQETYT